MRVIVYHSEFGCDTGCCGHVIQIDEFELDHPDHDEDPKEFAKRLVRKAFGKEHIADLDWDACVIKSSAALSFDV